MSLTAIDRAIVLWTLGRSRCAVPTPRSDVETAIGLLESARMQFGDAAPADAAEVDVMLRRLRAALVIGGAA